ncbi:MAG: TonB-dependent receptor, partial [Bacteroidaceae bacterium]|nr:TonB-dependent receptor [Bacteroidaceae bacterium]
TPTDDELADYNTRLEYWRSSKANRQLNWDYMYFANQQANAAGGECLYYVERRHNDQLTFNLGSTLNIDYDRFNKGTVGLQIGTTKGMHYKTMDDLMGADKYTDIDKFSVGDFGLSSDYVQNDVDNPNRQIGEGDVFGYNYDLYVNKASLFYQHQYNRGIFHLFAGANVDGTTMERFGHMRNGRAMEFSKGSSGVATFLGGGAKLGMVFTFNAYNTLSLGGGYENRAPLAYNSFIAPRMRNDFVPGLTNEDIYNAELSYRLNIGPVTAKVSGYFTQFNNLVEQSAFYNDQESQFTYLTMTGVNRRHYGLEAAIVYNITSSLSVNAVASVGDAEYTSNANGLLISENEKVWKNDLVYTKGVKADGTPLTAASLGVDYNIKGWYLSANVNYYDRIYVDASKYARLAEVVGAPVIDTNTGEEILNIPSQYKGKGGFIVDASIGKSISLRHGKKLNLNLQLCNLLNNTNMITGGYEQNRGDSYADGEARTYKFSKNPYLYYANAFNFYLNIGFRF